MQWYREEDSRLIKEWEASAEAKGLANRTVAISAGGHFLIAATIGVIARSLPEQSYTVDNLAERVATYISEEGWDERDFDLVARRLRVVVDQTPAHQRQYYREVEIVLLQNRFNILDDIPRQVEIIQPRTVTEKVPELV